jgi:hypothetical protein
LSSKATPKEAKEVEVAKTTNPYSNVEMNARAPRFFSKPLKSNENNKPEAIRIEHRKYKTFLNI